MPSLAEQYDIAISSLTSGDVDTLARMFTEPSSITPDEHRTAAEKMGFHGGMLQFIVNTMSDPMVWLAALTSRRFPFADWLRGTIPTRYVGMMNDFSGFGIPFRSIENFLSRGTHIPKLAAIKTQREMEVMKLGAEALKIGPDRLGTKWGDVKHIVSLLMEGQQPAGATQELRDIALLRRQKMDEAYNFLSRTWRVDGGFGGPEITKATARPFTPTEAPKYLRDYMAHIPQANGGTESMFIVDGKDAIKYMMSGHRKQAFEVAGMNPTDVWSVDRSGRLVSDWNRHQLLTSRVPSTVFNRHLYERQRHGLTIGSTDTLGQELFIADVDVAMQKYFHSLARTYSNNAPLTAHERALASFVRPETGERVFPSSDPIIVQVINQGLDAAGARFQRQQIRGTDKFIEKLVPGSPNAPTLIALKDFTKQLMGLQSEEEILFGNALGSHLFKLQNWGRRLAGKKQIDAAAYALDAYRRNQGYRDVNNMLVGAQYAGTMGLSVWSALQNAIQPISTTIPTIGIGSYVAGLAEFGKKIPSYFRNFASEYRALSNIGDYSRNFLARVNASVEGAFRRTFPEVAASGIRIDPRLFEADETMLAEGLQGKKAFRNMDALNRFLLQPFSHTEMANQVTTFYGTKHAIGKHLRTGEIEFPYMPDTKERLSGAALDGWINAQATEATNILNFRPRTGSRTIAQQYVPSPFRMFTSYPIGFGNYLVDSTVRGAMTEKQIEQAGLIGRITGGRNLGPLARTMLYGRIAYLGARDVLGVDLGGSLGLLAPFKGAPQGEAFAPFPTPPALDIVHGLVRYTTTRDLKELQPVTLPYVGDIPIPKTLFPGGLAISRAIRSFQQFRPDAGGFVDENERVMWRGDTTDLALSMLGIPLEKGRRTRHALEVMTGNKLAIRNYRRRMAMAQITGDHELAGALQGEYAKQFPDMPPLQIDPSDLQRYKENMMIPAVQRMAQSFGKQAPLMEESVAEYLGDYGDMVIEP